MVDPKPIIAVVGGTGLQGTGLVNSIIKEGKYVARVITRKPDDEKAKTLVKNGAVVVKADCDDVESLKKAFAGAYGVFAMTNFYETLSVAGAAAKVKNMIAAAKAAAVKHVVWSTSEDTRDLINKNPSVDIPIIKDGYRVPDMDGKGESNKLWFEAKVPTTLLYTSFYYDNFTSIFAPVRKDGVLTVSMPMEADKPMPAIASIDIGKCAYGIFKDTSTIGKTIAISGDQLTMPVYCQKMSKVLGEPVKYEYVPRAVFASFGFPGAPGIANMFQFSSSFAKESCQLRSVAGTKKVNAELQSFDDYLAKNGSKIPNPK